MLKIKLVVKTMLILLLEFGGKDSKKMFNKSNNLLSNLILKLNQVSMQREEQKRRSLSPTTIMMKPNEFINHKEYLL